MLFVVMCIMYGLLISVYGICFVVWYNDNSSWYEVWCNSLMYWIMYGISMVVILYEYCIEWGIDRMIETTNWCKDIGLIEDE